MNSRVHLAGDPEILPHLARLAVGPDLSDGQDPELAARIMALHDKKVAEHPEWAARLASVMAAATAAPGH